MENGYHTTRHPRVIDCINEIIHSDKVFILKKMDSSNYYLNDVSINEDGELYYENGSVSSKIKELKNINTVRWLNHLYFTTPG